MLTIDDFDFFLFTNDPALARQANAAGVRYIGPDLELIGKDQRQGGMNTWISSHTMSDLAEVYAAVAPERRFVRCNPVHAGLADELERALALGARAIMLPYFHGLEDVDLFVSSVGDRARKILLVETRAAADLLATLVARPGVDQVHIGLNDLRLDTGYRNHFELLCSDWMAELCDILAASGKRFGFGGIGRAMDASLPIPADLVYAQYPRLGARAALVSRVFTHDLAPADFPAAVEAALARLHWWFSRPGDELEQARRELLRRGQQL